MNEQHLSHLRSGVENWNEWRKRHPNLQPDLSHATLNFLAAKSTLDRNNSVFEPFQRRNFQGADLRNVNLSGAKIWLCDLQEANFQNANLQRAEIRRSQLASANFQGADMRQTQLITCDMTSVQLHNARFGATHLGYTKLRSAQGLDELQHAAESYIDQFSLIHSVPLPESFVKACKLSPLTLRMADLYLRTRPYHTCFLSYSRRDEAFVSYLREALTWAGVPSWFAPNDMRDESFQDNSVELERDLYNYVDEAELLLLVMSPNILSSSWVGVELLRVIHTSKKIIAVLIDFMPQPKSDEWNERIAIAAQNDHNGHFSPSNYSSALEYILVNGKFINFVDWRNPSGIAYFFSYLWPQLGRYS